MKNEEGRRKTSLKGMTLKNPRVQPGLRSTNLTYFTTSSVSSSASPYNGLCASAQNISPKPSSIRRR
jgi:hypothetical protein